MRVLVVTEDQDVLVPLRKILTEQGRDVLHSPRMTGVLDFIDKAEVDLVIADQHFTDGNGLALLETMRKAHPTSSRRCSRPRARSIQPSRRSSAARWISLPKPIERDETMAFLRRVDSMKTIREPVTGSSDAATEAPSRTSAACTARRRSCATRSR